MAVRSEAFAFGVGGPGFDDIAKGLGGDRVGVGGVDGGADPVLVAGVDVGPDHVLPFGGVGFVGADQVEPFDSEEYPSGPLWGGGEHEPERFDLVGVVLPVVVGLEQFEQVGG